MKSGSIRPINFWKSAIMTMPDSSFFELLRSVFGKIKTPFNKQQLLNDLESFLLREDIQKTITAYINETEKKIIAAIYLFGEPTLEQLEDFFCEDDSDSENDDDGEQEDKIEPSLQAKTDVMNYAELQDIIVNMEERFLLYRFTEEKPARSYSPSNAVPSSYIALNPVLKQVLIPIAVDSSSLFPIAGSKKTSRGSSARRANTNSEKSFTPAISELTIAALYSFVLKHESFFRQGSGILKRVKEDGKSFFPNIDLENTVDTLQLLGLFYTEADKLIPDKKRFNDFCVLTARERMIYVCAAMTIYTSLTPPFEIMPPLYKNRLREITSLTQTFLESLNTKITYPEITLKRIVEIIKIQTGIQIETELLFNALEKTGLLCIENGLAKIINFDIENKNRPVIAIDSNTLIIVYPEINFSDAVKLTSFANINKTSTAVIFELSKDSAVRAFNNNINADKIIEILKRLSGGKVEDALIWNLRDWEKRYGEVSLKRGIVLQLAEDQRYLKETKHLVPLISETLAPGVYLLDEDKMEEAASALQKAGIDIVARRNDKNESSSITSFMCTFPSLSSMNTPIKLTYSEKQSAANEADEEYAEENIKAGFRAILEKMTLTEIEKAELSARIDRRLVICGAQLKDADIRYEKTEAKHMDYTGKQNIIKQAISQHSPVEIVLTVKNKVKKIYGVPQAMEKAGDNLIIVINSERIPLAKISLLRKIKKSIFEK